MAIKQTYRKPETVDIVETLVNSMSFRIENDTDYIDNGDGTYTLNVCRTYWVKVGDSFTVDLLGTEYTYTVTNLIKDTSITVSSSDGNYPVIVNAFDVESPKYYHGTVINTNLELNGEQFAENCTPMIYFLEQYTETYFTNDSILDRETNIRLFFLESANFQDWNTDEHYENAIYYTRQMLDYFIYEVLFKTKGIHSDLIEDYATTNRVNFGVYTTDRGSTNKIFDKELTGIELQINLPITKNYIDCYC